jgi:hypothetical protein
VPLFNVRLDDDDARRAKELREAGVPIARIVRNAIRAEHEYRVTGRVRRQTPRKIMARIYAEHPDPPGTPKPRVDLRDRRAVRKAIVRRLRRR